MKLFTRFMNWLTDGLKSSLTEHTKTLQQADARLQRLEESHEALAKRLDQKCWVIEKVVIERLQTDKVELRLDSIDVKELSGMLSIGLNHGGTLIKNEYKGDKEPGKNSPQHKEATRPKLVAGRASATKRSYNLHNSD